MVLYDLNFIIVNKAVVDLISLEIEQITKVVALQLQVGKAVLT